jgi:antitoxin (DNA-binding transcriptional repressor) of toxin-antitoxin stability system
MKTVSIADFKSNFSTYADKVEKGEEIIVTRGRGKKQILKVSPIKDEPKVKRKLGILKSKVKVKFHKDWKMSEEEFLDFKDL